MWTLCCQMLGHSPPGQARAVTAQRAQLPGVSSYTSDWAMYEACEPMKLCALTFKAWAEARTWACNTLWTRTIYVFAFGIRRQVLSTTGQYCDQHACDCPIGMDDAVARPKPTPPEVDLGMQCPLHPRRCASASRRRAPWTTFLRSELKLQLILTSMLPLRLSSSLCLTRREILVNW